MHVRYNLVNSIGVLLNFNLISSFEINTPKFIHEILAVIMHKK